MGALNPTTSPSPSAPPEARPAKSRKARRLTVLAWCIAAIAGIGLLWQSPVTTGIIPPCLFHKYTGLHCPGCGTSRALHHLIHGRILLALQHNPLSMVALPTLAGLGAWRWLRRGRWVGLSFKTHARLAWCLFVVVILYWVLRNLPYYPFTLLAPP